MADALRPQVAHIQAVDTSAGELVDHYAVFISQLAELFALLGTSAPDDPFLLSHTIAGYLEQIRVTAGVQKARAYFVACDLSKAIAEKGWSGIHIKYDFTNGMSLLRGFATNV